METDSVTDRSQPTVPPTSATSPVSPVIPALKSKRNVLMWVVGGIVISSVVTTIVIGLVLWKFPPKQITSFEECIKAKGSYIQESNPPTCVTAKGLSFKKTISPITQPSESETSPFSDLANNWKTYMDTSFSFKYPPSITVTYAKQGLGTIFKIVGLDKEISLVVEPVTEHNFYANKKTSDTFTFNKIDWNYLTGDTKFCDVGECGRISDALQTTEQGKRYTVVLGNLPYPNTIVDQILSTFKFLDEEGSNSVYECPTTQYVNCMPIVAPGEPEKKCEKTYLDWAVKNCPTFKGPVY